jgi:hypothetical protein
MSRVETREGPIPLDRRSHHGPASYFVQMISVLSRALSHWMPSGHRKISTFYAAKKISRRVEGPKHVKDVKDRDPCTNCIFWTH